MTDRAGLKPEVVVGVDLAGTLIDFLVPKAFRLRDLKIKLHLLYGLSFESFYVTSVDCCKPLADDFRNKKKIKINKKVNK